VNNQITSFKYSNTETASSCFQLVIVKNGSPLLTVGQLLTDSQPIGGGGELFFTITVAFVVPCAHEDS